VPSKVNRIGPKGWIFRQSQFSAVIAFEEIVPVWNCFPKMPDGNKAAKPEAGFLPLGFGVGMTTGTGIVRNRP